MTGRHPFRVNVPNHGHYLRLHETTVAEALGSAGYVTGHFGKWHIGSVQKESPTSPGGAGFDEWLSGLTFSTMILTRVATANTAVQRPRLGDRYGCHH